jgi:GDP-D-mannose dehydratase
MQSQRLFASNHTCSVTRGDSSKARDVFGRRPKINFKDLAHWMIDADRKIFVLQL